MAAAFVPTQIVDVVIAAEATGHVFMQEQNCG